MASLAEIRAKLKEQENRGTSSSATTVDNAIYPFWNMKEGEQCTVRFLPDGDEANTFFWKERLMIKLPFAGIKGETDSRPVQVQVPCMEMYNENCPVLTEVRTWFKDKSLEDMGKKYWKKRSYLFQGFVVDSPLDDDSTPQNPIRRFIIGPQIYKIISSALMDPDMEELPTDYTAGLDFRLVKSTKGSYADYSTSNWARRERPLSDEQVNAINEHGLYQLSDFLPKKPTEVELKVIKEMFEASVDGEAYDTERWGQYYRPAGVSAQTGDPSVGSAPRTESYSEPVKVSQPQRDPEPEAPQSSGGAEDILAIIRARQTQ